MKSKKDGRVIAYLVKTVTVPPAMHTKSITGRLAAPPKVGERMMIIGRRGLENRDVPRIMTTSPVMEIRVQPKSVLVFTHNSVYSLREL